MCSKVKICQIQYDSKLSAGKRWMERFIYIVCLNEFPLTCSQNEMFKGLKLGLLNSDFRIALWSASFIHVGSQMVNL